jgi:hypothetical protein
MDSLSKKAVEDKKIVTEKVPAPKPKETPIKPTAPTAQPPKVVQAPIVVSEELKVLFEFKTATDLSEKLSQAPIKDLKTSMGLNERFLIISELFKGDAGRYNQAIDALNSFENFEQAKAYILTNIASEFDWGNEKRKTQAANFVKKVRRRYL